MKLIKHTLLLSIILLLLAGCQPGRIQTATTLTIEFGPAGFSLSARSILAGETITLTLINPTPEAHTLHMLADSVSDFKTPLPTKNLLLTVSIPANQTVEVVFTAPRAAGSYYFVCSQPAHLDKGESIKLTVVQPAYAR